MSPGDLGCLVVHYPTTLAGLTLEKWKVVVLMFLGWQTPDKLLKLGLRNVPMNPRVSLLQEIPTVGMPRWIARLFVHSSNWDQGSGASPPSSCSISSCKRGLSGHLTRDSDNRGRRHWPPSPAQETVGAGKPYARCNTSTSGILKLKDPSTNK